MNSKHTLKVLGVERDDLLCRLHSLSSFLHELDDSSKQTTCQQIKVRACSIINNEHPEWGTFGVMEDHGEWFSIYGRAGHRTLFKSEADKFWHVVNQ